MKRVFFVVTNVIIRPPMEVSSAEQRDFLLNILFVVVWFEEEIMYYPTSTGIWPNAYPGFTQQQQGIPAMYYQMPSMATVPDVMTQQSIPTVYYQAPTVTAPPITTSEVVTQQPPQVNATTTSKTVTTRVLDPTTITKTEVIPTQTTVNETNIPRRPQNYPRGLRTFSSSTDSDLSTTSTESTITPQPEVIKQNPVIHPPPFPVLHTTNMAPVHRVVHRPYTPSGYYSSELDYGRRKIYKTDYKYRHYYCCNICKGRCDLHNRSYSCCEWFYGCPVWSLLFCGLLFLGLLAGFFALLGLQPSINSSRYSETAETRLINRTQVVYGFYQNCGYQVNATVNTATTLILCANTGTTTTARIQLSAFYTVISGTEKPSYSTVFIFIGCFIVFI